MICVNSLKLDKSSSKHPRVDGLVGAIGRSPSRRRHVAVDVTGTLSSASA